MANARKSSHPYHEIFFTWCAPGAVLVMVGKLSGRPVLAHFGMALLSIGVLYYGKVKQHRRLWFVAWLLVSVIYLALGFTELAH